MRSIARIACSLLWANPGRLIVLVAGAVSIALATSGMFLAASTSLAIVRQTVDAGWRGTYDILVLPGDSPSLTIDGRALVPPDYLGLRTSGISRTEWQQIANLANVEVAAPVAALGWLKNQSPDVGVELTDVKPGDVYYVEVDARIAGQEAAHASGLVGAPAAGEFPVQVGITNYIGVDPVYISLGALPPTWGLVVGIDPAAEDALLGLTDYVNGEYLSTGTYEVYDQSFGRNAIAVPLLTAARSTLPGDLTVTLSRVDGLTPDQIAAALAADPPQSKDELDKAIEQLVAVGSLTRLATDDAQLVELLHPLRATAITLGVDGKLVSTTQGGGGFAIDDNIVLVPSLGGYEPSSGPSADLTLRPLGLWQDVMDPQLDAARDPNWSRPPVTFGGDATVYRDLAVTAPSAFTLVQLGTYDREAIDEHFGTAANDAPLGVYAATPRMVVANESGQPIADSLAVSLNPSGLNPQPPVGLTNLEAVEALRGERFIDAIRVRVRGISGYTPESVRRIETVAQQIIETTGLQVDVIAGSSPVNVRVAVPGVGIISERWTTLGTAVGIVSGAEGLSAVLLGAALIVVAAYLAAFGTFLSGDQAAEVGILRRVGWRRRSVIALVAAQALALGVLAAGLTVGLVVALASASNQRISGASLAVAAASVLVAHPLAAGVAGFARRARRRRPQTSERPVLARRLDGIAGLAVTFAFEAPARAAVVAVATALALAVAGLVATIEVASAGELRTTVFGAVVAVRLASYHLLASAAALFAAGAMILDGALLTVERRLSLIGTLRAVGWRSRAIRYLVTLEAALPAVLAGLVAAGLVGVIATSLSLGWAALALALGVLVLAIALAAVTTQLPAGVAVRTAPAATLRAEGASGVVGGFAPRQALLTVTALVVIVGLVAGGWSAAEGAASKPLPFVRPTEHPFSPVAMRIQSDVVALSAFPDRLPGSSNFEEASGYIADGLLEAGYTVETRAYLSPQAQYLNSEGEPVESAGVFSPAIAYDAVAWDGRNVDLPVVFTDGRGGRLPRDCPDGIAVVRIAASRQVRLAHELQQQCIGRTQAVLAVRAADDDTWLALTDRATRVRLRAASLLTAVSPNLSASTSAPWLVVALDSRGPGASQSAAPAAVMLEVARAAIAREHAMRVGVVSQGDSAAGSVFVERLAAEAPGPLVWLGPMGGQVAPVLGTKADSRADPEAATAGLLWIAPVDRSFADWLARANAPSNQPTSAGLLDVLSRATGIAPGDEANLNAGPLTAGLDAAWLGEPQVPTIGPPSIAGTEADTAAQIHPRDLEQLASGIITAIGELDR